MSRIKSLFFNQILVKPTIAYLSPFVLIPDFGWGGGEIIFIITIIKIKLTI